MSDLSNIPTEELLRLRAAAMGGPHSARPLTPSDPNAGLSREAAASAAAEEPSNPVIGLGRRVDKIVRGGTQGFLKAREALSPQDPAIKEAISGFDTEGQENDRAYKAYARESPNAAGFGEALPTLPMGGGFLSLPAKASIPGLVSEGNADERLRMGGVDAAAAGVGNTLGKAAGGFLNPNLSKVQRDTLTEGRARDIYPRLSQVTGSPTVQKVEDWANMMPIGGGVMEDARLANAKGFNRTAAESMGQNVDSAGQVGPEVFAKAKRDMQAVFDEVDHLPNAPRPGPGASPPAVYTGVQTSNGTATRGAPPIVVGPEVERAAVEALRQQTMQISPDSNLTRLANEAIHAARNNGAMTGEAYQNLYHELTNASYNAFKAGEPKSGRAWASLRDAIDKSADDSLRQMGRGDLAERLQIARSQWGNFKTLEEGRIAEGGNVNPARVAQSVRTNNPDAFRTGRTDGSPLGFIARWAELFPELREGSQTAMRTETGRMIRNPTSAEAAVGAIASPALAKLTTSPAITRIPATLGGTPAGAVAGAIAEPTISGSVQSFLRRILRPQTP